MITSGNTSINLSATPTPWIWDANGTNPPPSQVIQDDPGKNTITDETGAPIQQN
jgi:hypothetical protein